MSAACASRDGFADCYHDNCRPCLIAAIALWRRRPTENTGRWLQQLLPARVGIDDVRAGWQPPPNERLVYAVAPGEEG